ncbi:MAG: hypothetical protein GXO39_02145 [Thermotogae bacterium]|nr:hypothetical protein [Thermotogota bacterium]
MRRIGAILIIGAVALFDGCATVVVESPKKVQLAQEGEVLNGRIYKKKVWYALWGLLPLTDNSTRDLLGSCQEKARIRRYIGVDDAIIGTCTGCLTLYPLTVEVECK